MKHRRSRGATTMEYGVLAGLVGVVALSSVIDYGRVISSLFDGGTIAVSDVQARSAASGGSPLSEEDQAPEGLEMSFTGSNVQFDLLSVAGETTVDWGDGSSTVSPDGFAILTHAYSTPGTYTIRVTGDTTWIALSAGITEVMTWGQLPLNRLENSFSQATDLVALPSWVPSSIQDFTYAFAQMNLSHTIRGPESWDVSHVTNMDHAFYSSSNIPDLSSWNVSGVTDFSEMFYNSEFNWDVSDWNVGSGADFTSMFENSPFNSNIGGWDMSNATDITAMFSGTPFNHDISSWDTSAVESSAGAFAGAMDFDQDLSGWDVSSVTDMSRMFYAAASFDRDLSAWCVQQIPDAPTGFDEFANSWTLPSSRPAWGAAC